MYPTDRALESIEARAHAASFAACPGPLAAGLGLRAEPGPDRLLVAAARIPEVMFNRAFGWGVDEPLDDVALWRLTTRWIKVVGPAAEVPLPPTNLQIRRVVDPVRWGDTVRSGFGMPPVMGEWLAALAGRPRWTLFEAVDGEVPVAGAALYVAGEAAWLGMGASLPAARGRGAQSGLIAARIREAARQGAVYVVSETGEETPTNPNASARNLQRAGLAIRYHRENWARGVE